MAKESKGGVGGLVKIGLLLGGGYWVYKSYMETPTGASSSTTTVTATTNPGGGGLVMPPLNKTVEPTQVQNVTDLLSSITKGMTEFASGGTYDEWNWARGQFQSAPQGIEEVFPGMARNQKLSLEQYVAGLRAKGIAGYRDSLGLGQIMNLGEFFSATPRRRVIAGNFR